jgi:hypothetical protein
MTRFSWKFFFSVVVIFFVGSLRAAAQQDSAASQGESSSSNPNANVVLGGGTGSPGASVVVPIYVNPPKGTEIGQLKLQVTFVSVNLKYDKVESGIAAEMGDVGIKAETAAGKNDKDVETTTLTVTATAPAGSPPKGIPPGLLAYIMLNVSDKGRLATIALRTKIEATEAGTNKALTNVTVADSSVEVVAPGDQPVVGCFFFTH